MADGGRLLREGLVAPLGAGEGPLAAPCLAYGLGGGSFGQACGELDSLCSDGCGPAWRLGVRAEECASNGVPGASRAP